jgi:hypothetical protein
MRKIIIFGLLLFPCTLWGAQNYEYICTYGDQTRVIGVEYSGEGDVPCEVNYTKSSGSEVVWWADNLAGFCESKAKALMEKQRGWGWQCSESPDVEMDIMVEEDLIEVETISDNGDVIDVVEEEDLIEVETDSDTDD